MPNYRFFKLRIAEQVLGSLAPWNNEWYWSGEQSLIPEASAEVMQALCQDLLKQTGQLVYRYDKVRLAEAQETLARIHQLFGRTFGDELVSFPDGVTMAGAMQQMYRQHNEGILEAAQGAVPAELNPQPTMPYPGQLIDSENGIGVFFHAAEGTEMMTGFNEVVSGFKKRGEDLSEDEADAIQGFIEAEAISPQFVQRLVDEYGAESVAAAYLIRDPVGHPYLDYLLHQHKGHFYRRRYPSLTLV